MAYKVFEWDGRTGSMMDRISNTLTNISNSNTLPFVQTEKGLAIDHSNLRGSKYLHEFSKQFDGEKYSIVLWFKRNVTRIQYIFSNYDNSAAIYISSNNSIFELGDGTIYLNNSTDSNIYTPGLWAHVLLNGVTLPDLSGVDNTFYIFGSLNNGSLNITGLNPYFAIYKGTLTEKERNKSYQDFLNSKPISPSKRNFLPAKKTRYNIEDYSVEDIVYSYDDLDFTNWTNVNTSSETDKSFTTSTGGGQYKAIVNQNQYYKVRIEGTINVTATISLPNMGISQNGTSFLLEDVLRQRNNNFFYINVNAARTVTITSFSINEVSKLIAAYNMIPNQDGTITDLTYTGYDLTLINNPLLHKEGLYLNGDNQYLTLPTIYLSTKWSINIRWTPESNSAYWTILGQASTDSQNIYMNTTFIRIRSVTINTNLIYPNQESSLTIVSNDSGEITIYLDGVKVIDNYATTTDFIAFNQLFLYKTSQYTNANVKNLEIYYNKALTDQDAKMYNNKWARQTYLKEDFKYDPIVESNVLPKGWTPGTGTFKINELLANDSILSYLSAGTKYIECLTAGTLSIPSKQAYGTWEFELYKGAELNNIFIELISSILGDRTITTGYELAVFSSEAVGLYKWNGGAAVSEFLSNGSYIINNVWYGIKITRSLDGTFSVYIKGGSFGDEYILVVANTGTNPVTDNTYTTSNFMVLDLDAGDRIANIKLTKGIIV